MDIEKSVGFLLAKAYQKACAIFKEYLDPYGLTPQQFSLLAFLWQQDGLSQAELSTKSQIDRTTMGGLIDRLQADGLVRRLPHPDDRRAHHICLTEKGKGLEDELCALATTARDRFVAGLSEQEHDSLQKLLEKLRY